MLNWSNNPSTGEGRSDCKPNCYICWPFWAKHIKSCYIHGAHSWWCPEALGPKAVGRTWIPYDCWWFWGLVLYTLDCILDYFFLYWQYCIMICCYSGTKEKYHICYLNCSWKLEVAVEILYITPLSCSSAWYCSYISAAILSCLAFSGLFSAVLVCPSASSPARKAWLYIICFSNLDHEVVNVCKSSRNVCLIVHANFSWIYKNVEMSLQDSKDMLNDIISWCMS